MLDLLIAGAATGLLFGSFFITFTCVLIFFMYKDGNLIVKRMLESSTPTKFVMSVVMFSNPSFAALGVVFAFVYQVFENIYPLKILVIPNLFYMMFVVIMVIPIAALFIRLINAYYAVIFMCLGVYVVLFGILIPLLVN